EPLEFASGNRRLLGTKMGTTPIKKDIPALIALYRQGRLKLDELITGRYRLDQINQAIDSTMAGEALRNVIVF
ncbi:MAG: zinc-binding dehydrogenase, partial [Hyphomicrobiaceae bacterium]